jgi:hypothetical protein
MVEENAIASVDPVSLAVVDADPVGIEFRNRVRIARVERRGLLLRRLLHQAVEFAGTRLVKPRFLLEADDANRFEQTQRT